MAATVAATALVAGTLANGGDSAQADAYSYCRVLVPARTDCVNASGGSYRAGIFYYNEAQYAGSGTVSVCEHAYYADSGATVSDRCANNDAGSSSDLNYSCTYGLITTDHVGNNDSSRHTIDGYAQRGNGSGC